MVGVYVLVHFDSRVPHQVEPGADSCQDLTYHDSHRAHVSVGSADSQAHKVGKVSTWLLSICHILMGSANSIMKKVFAKVEILMNRKCVSYYSANQSS